MKAIRMQHTRDPKEVIAEQLMGMQADFQPMADEVLCAIYVRPEKTSGGLVISHHSQEEDVYQGKVGLVLAMGPLAFKEDADHNWGGVIPKVGDWVLWRIGDTFPFILGKQHCRFVKDNYIKAIIPDPDIAL